MKKSVCWFLAVMLFCAVAYGGCGGNSSSLAEYDDESQSQDVTPTPTPTPTPMPTPTPTDPVTPTPQSQDVTPTPTQPDTQTTPETPSGQADLNGTWQIDSGSVHLNFPSGFGSYTWPYVEGSASAPTFEIAVSKNTADEYYTVKLVGGGVAENEFSEGLTSWYISCVFRNDNLNTPSELNLDNEIKDSGGLGGNTQFTHPDSNSYEYSSSVIYRIIDNSTIYYRVNFANSLGDPDFSYAELTLKRVN